MVAVEEQSTWICDDMVIRARIAGPLRDPLEEGTETTAATTHWIEDVSPYSSTNPMAILPGPQDQSSRMRSPLV